MFGRILITYPDSLDTPGGGTIGCLEIARHLKDLGIEVMLLPVLYPDSDTFNELVPVKPVNPAPGHYLLNAVSFYYAVRKELARGGVGAVLSWDYEAALLPGLLRSSGVTFGMIPARPSYKIWLNRPTRLKVVKRMSDRWFRWRPLREADVLFPLSAFSRAEIISLFGVEPERVVVGHWGVDKSFLAIPRNRPMTINRFIFFGSLAPLKGIFDAIEALSIVAQSGYQDWTLKVAGWGDESAVLEAAQRHGIVDKVFLIGRLDHDALRRELEWAQVAILPSHAESFGLAIAEAQVAGLPVVSYRIGSVPEVVEDGITGILVPVGDVRQVAEAIRQLLKNPEQAFCMGLAGRERIQRLFSWEQTAQTILDTLQRLRASKSSQ